MFVCEYCVQMMLGMYVNANPVISIAFVEWGTSTDMLYKRPVQQYSVCEHNDLYYFVHS